jgi:chorismate mutase/prephenate dehydrogenase
MDAGSAEAMQAARALFASTMAQQTEMELEDHDRLIAYVLGLSHALNIAFFGVLANSGEAVPRLADLSSTTFDSQLAVASKVAQENPQLYYEIQSLNQHGLEPLEALSEVLSTIIDSVKNGDKATFMQLMERGRKYLAARP